MESRGAPEASDDALITASLREPQAFGLVFDRHGPIVHRYLTSRAGIDAADDLLSEVFVAAFRRRMSYDTRYSSAVPWLFGIANNVIRHHHRAEGRRRALLGRLGLAARGRSETFDDTSSEMVGRADFELVRHALADLDPKYRDVVILYASFDLSYEEIATSLGLRVGTVRSRLARGRARLRELLADSGQHLADDERPNSRHSELEETPQ